MESRICKILLLACLAASPMQSVFSITEKQRIDCENETVSATGLKDAVGILEKVRKNQHAQLVNRVATGFAAQLSEASGDSRYFEVEKIKGADGKETERKIFRLSEDNSLSLTDREKIRDLFMRICTEYSAADPDDFYPITREPMALCVEPQLAVVDAMATNRKNHLGEIIEAANTIRKNPKVNLLSLFSGSDFKVDLETLSIFKYGSAFTVPADRFEWGPAVYDDHDQIQGRMMGIASGSSLEWYVYKCTNQKLCGYDVTPKVNAFASTVKGSIRDIQYNRLWEEYLGPLSVQGEPIEQWVQEQKRQTPATN